MKKILSLILAAFMLAATLCACAPSDSAGGENPYGLTTVTPGVLTVATSPDYAPYEFYVVGEDGKASLAGFDIALAHYIADYLGLTLELVPMDFDGTIEELTQKRCDLGMAGYSPKPERAEVMDFTAIYYNSEQSLITVKSKADAIPDLAASNDPKLKIGVQVGSIQADLAHENSPDADIVELAKVTDIISELLSGKLDAAYIETPVLEAYSANYPELCAVCQVPYEASGNVIGVSKGNTKLLEYVNKALAAAIEDGSFNKFVAEAVEQATGDTFEGVLDENGNLPSGQ